MQLTNERIGEREEQCNTNSDHRYSVEQGDDDEHLRLQHRRELRLTRSTLEKAAAQKTHANTDAKGAEADQKCNGDRREANNSFHQFLLTRNKSK